MRSVLSIVALLCVIAAESAPSPQRRQNSEDGGNRGPLFPILDVKGLLTQLQDYRNRLVESRKKIADTITEPLGGFGRPHRKHGRPGSKDSEAEDKEQDRPNKQPTEDKKQDVPSKQPTEDNKQGTRNQEPDKQQEEPKNSEKILDQRSKDPEDEQEGQKPAEPIKSLPPKPFFPLPKPTDQEPVKGSAKPEGEPLKGLPSLPGGNPEGQPPKTIPLPPPGSQPMIEDWSNVPKPQAKEANGGIDDLKRKIIGAPCLGGVDHSGSCRSSSYD